MYYAISAYIEIYTYSILVFLFDETKMYVIHTPFFPWN
jgi:hypothetical protein